MCFGILLSKRFCNVVFFMNWLQVFSSFFYNCCWYMLLPLWRVHFKLPAFFFLFSVFLSILVIACFTSVWYAFLCRIRWPFDSCKGPSLKLILCHLLGQEFCCRSDAYFFFFCLLCLFLLLYILCLVAIFALPFLLRIEASHLCNSCLLTCNSCRGWLF